MDCPMCGQELREPTTVAAWDHIVACHREWQRELIALPDDDGEAAVKDALHRAFPGIVG